MTDNTNVVALCFQILPGKTITKASTPYKLQREINIYYFVLFWCGILDAFSLTHSVSKIYENKHQSCIRQRSKSVISRIILTSELP